MIRNIENPIAITKRKSKRGAQKYLSIALSFIIIMVCMFGCRLVLMLIDRNNYQQAIESAAIKAATDLSEIVINDPYYGFISLSDKEAIGQATKAADGEPLPVHSINTIIATTRLDYMTALETNDSQIEELALEDIRHAREAAVRLHKVNQVDMRICS